MKRQFNYTSKLSKSRIERILEIARTKPISALDVSAEVLLSENMARDYLNHLRDSGAVIEDRTVRRTVFYKATGVYHPELLEITAEEPVRKAPYVKPFRCTWTSLFFGPATDSGRDQVSA